MASKRKCAVPGCLGEDGSVSYHVFPASSERRKMWLEALGVREPLRNVCSLHFESAAFVSSVVPEAWEAAGYKRRRLRNDAVPMCRASSAPTLLAASNELRRANIEDDTAVREQTPCVGEKNMEPFPPVQCYQLPAFALEGGANVEARSVPATVDPSQELDCGDVGLQCCSEPCGPCSDHDYFTTRSVETQTDPPVMGRTKSIGVQTSF